ncbi:MAG: dihydroneopterin aldolase [Bdellovibrionota bacterium]
MIQVIRQQLRIQDFEVWVHLGCTLEEQKHTQPVHYNFEINFGNPVIGCQTDQLTDAIDYVKITSILKMISTEKSFHLIEHLNQQAFNGVAEYLKSRNLKAEVKLSVKKIRVPVENLKDGVVFSCEAKL